MKKCELCNSVLRMYCESDQASLCWACDYRVHKVNFIVAKHTRTLLCQACQSPTPWTGSGSKLSPTVSVCESCVGRRELGNDSRVGDEEEEEEEEEEAEEEEEDDENQVVPPSSSSNENMTGFRTKGSSHEEKNGQSWRWQ